MNDTAPLSPDVLGTPESIANPYPAYRAFRGASPVRYLRLPAGPISGRDTPLYAWAVLRHADVLASVKDPATFSSHSPAVIKALPKLALLHDDPPHHTHLRRIVNKAFAPQRVAALSESISRLAGELLDAAGRGPVEFMSSYAMPLPMRVIARMLGVTERNMMGLLAERPELWREAREDRSLVDPIIEEVLRYESPVQRFPRVTTRPVKIGEVEMGDGELIELTSAAAPAASAVQWRS